jgi:hypothetical protein
MMDAEMEQDDLPETEGQAGIEATQTVQGVAC